jgi:OOP family OmpA-OmpF porin
MLNRVTGALGLALLLAACQSSTQAVVAAAAPKPAEQPRTFALFFRSDSAQLSPEAMKLVKEAAIAAKTRGDAHILAVGHTDTIGAGTYNLALSQRRATAVKQALVDEGVPAEAIEASGQGEESLFVVTRDNIREAQNRRVEVTVQ